MLRKQLGPLFAASAGKWYELETAPVMRLADRSYCFFCEFSASAVAALLHQTMLLPLPQGGNSPFVGAIHLTRDLLRSPAALSSAFYADKTLGQTMNYFLTQVCGSHDVVDFYNLPVNVLQVLLVCLSGACSLADFIQYATAVFHGLDRQIARCIEDGRRDIPRDDDDEFDYAFERDLHSHVQTHRDEILLRACHDAAVQLRLLPPPPDTRRSWPQKSDQVYTLFGKTRMQDLPPILLNPSSS